MDKFVKLVGGFSVVVMVITFLIMLVGTTLDREQYKGFHEMNPFSKLVFFAEDNPEKFEDILLNAIPFTILIIALLSLGTKIYYIVKKDEIKGVDE